jgi:hypothetical protein
MHPLSKVTRRAYLLAIAAMVLGSTHALAQVAPADAARNDAARKDAVTAGLALGIGMFRAAQAGLSTDWPPGVRTTSEQVDALKKTLADYQTKKAEYQGHILAMRAVSDFAVNGTAIVVASTGVGLVPAMIVKAGGQMAADAWVGDFERNIGKALDATLAAKKNQLLNVAGVKYEDLQRLPPAQLKDRLERSTKVFDDMKQLMAGDAAGLNMAKDLLVQGIINTQRVALQRMKTTEAEASAARSEVGRLARNFTAFRKHTLDRLEDHRLAVDGLQTSVGNLQKSVTVVEGRLAVQERNGAIVADFVFSQMPPKAKQEAVAGGLLDRQLNCSDKQPCEKRQELIERFAGEARVQERIEILGKTASALTDVSKITKNLNLDVKGLDEAVNVANVVVGAYAQFATGNVLGAIASASSLFGKPAPDPAQVRHEQMMRFLKQEFSQINEKLDKIIVGQQKLMDAVVALSEQMRKQHQTLLAQLARMEFELNRVSSTVRMTLWGQLASCFGVYEKYRDKYIRADRSDPSTNSLGDFGDFTSIDQIRELAASTNISAIDCLREVQKLPVLNGGAEWFGNFLSAHNAVKLPTGATGGLPGSEKSKLEQFIDGTHAPALRLLHGSVEKQNWSWAMAFAQLSQPAGRVSDTRRRGSTGERTVPCGANGFLLARVQPMLCGGTPSTTEHQKAYTLLAVPVVDDFAIDFGQWMLVVSRIADITNQLDGGKTMDASELRDAIRAGQPFETGRDMIGKAQRMTDYSIAAASLLSGDIMARAVLHALISEVQGDPARVARANDARSLLKGNGYLANNVVMLLLHDSISERPGAPSPMLAYRVALDFAATRSDAATRFGPLEELFGLAKPLVFEVDLKTKRPSLRLTPDVLVALPGPHELNEGRMVYPPRMLELLQMQERLVERQLDYDFVRTIPQASRYDVLAHISRPKAR